MEVVGFHAVSDVGVVKGLESVDGQIRIVDTWVARDRPDPSVGSDDGVPACVRSLLVVDRDDSPQHGRRDLSGSEAVPVRQVAVPLLGRRDGVMPAELTS